MPRTEWTSRERKALDRAIRAAETRTRLEFSVFRGKVDGEPRAYAQRLHALMAAPARSILVLTDARGTVIEIVTGADAQVKVPDTLARAAVVSMQEDFAAGDLIGGVVRGLAKLSRG